MLPWSPDFPPLIAEERPSGLLTSGNKGNSEAFVKGLSHELHTEHERSESLDACRRRHGFLIHQLPLFPYARVNLTHNIRNRTFQRVAEPVQP